VTDPRLALCHWATDAHYRTLPQACILDMLALAGWTYEARTGKVDATYLAVEALELLVAQGLPVSDGPEGRCFDPVEVLNFIKWQGLAGKNDFWRQRFVATGRRMVEDLARVSGAVPIAITMGYKRTFGPGSYPTGRSTRYRLPLPIPHPSLADLRIEDVATGGLPWQISTDGCRLEVRGDPGQTDSFSISQSLRFTLAPTVHDPKQHEDLDAYLSPAEGLIQVTDRVRALAASLTRPSDSQRKKVDAFWNYFLDHLCLGAVHYDQFGATSPATDQVLETGWFDCQVGSALLVSLCRACGIPARLMGGVLLYPAAPTPHYWCEIWFDGKGWQPFDLACWDLSAGGRDQSWRNHFAGRIDARLTTERFPLQFTGPAGAQLPAAWHVASAMVENGARTALYGVNGGALIYSNDVTVAFDDNAHVGRLSSQSLNGTA
jgi:Transglutaminase-like superfamily